MISGVFFIFIFFFTQEKRGGTGCHGRHTQFWSLETPRSILETELHSSANCQRRIVLFISNSNTTLIYFSSLNNLLFLLPLFFYHFTIDLHLLILGPSFSKFWVGKKLLIRVILKTIEKWS